VKSKFETRWARLAFTTEKMIKGKRTSPEMGVGSLKRRGVCSFGLSRSRGGGTGLNFGSTTGSSFPSVGEELSPVVGRRIVSGETGAFMAHGRGLLFTAGGPELGTGVFAALGFAVKGTSLSLSCDLASSSEIRQTGGNLASPSFGETFRTKI
jgi:hypothetical protein